MSSSPRFSVKVRAGWTRRRWLTGIGAAGAALLRGFPAEKRPDAPNGCPPVLNGVDVLAAEGFQALRGRRLGLITNVTGHDRFRRRTLDLLAAEPRCELRRVFTPEHGLAARKETAIPDGVEPRTGLPLVSLYGARRKPAPEHLRDLDALVFDIQDIGVRFYTYIATMGLAMEAAAEANVRFVVLDRVNPIRGDRMDGPVYEGPSRFTAFHSLPVRHGMTVGELARMFAAERGLRCPLTVVPLRGWRRGMWFDQTGLPWTNPSPNIRTPAQAALYPGIGILETANLSVGRGTDTPFELVGAPYIDDVRLACELRGAPIPGAAFVPARFTPLASKHAGKECGGVRVELLDRDACRPLDAGLAIAGAIHRLYPDRFDLDRINVLLQDPPTLAALRRGEALSSIRARWRPQLDAFETQRRRFLLY